jgi:fucose 4-O-acetylase-like acetyltransferase
MAQLKDSIYNGFSKAFNLQALSYSRWKWVDYLKGIAIVLVVYRHVLIGIERTGATVPGWIINLNMIFFNFRMPLFFILAGLFIGGSLAKRTVGKLVNIKFQHLLYPYLVWAFIQISLQILLAGSTNSNRSWVDYTYIFYQPRALDQFWYLPALFFTSIIFVLIKTKLHATAWVQLVLGMVFYFVGPYLDSISIVSDWMSFYIFFALGDALSGIFFQKRSQAFLKNIWSLVLLTPVFILVQVYYLNSPLSSTGDSANTGNLELMGISLVGCLYMFILAFHLEKWNILSFLRILGYHSLYIYVMHVMVQAFFRMVLTKYLGVDQPVVLLGTGIAFGVIVPVIFYNLVRNNMGRFLFSPEKKQQPKQPKPVKQPDLIPQ